MELYNQNSIFVDASKKGVLGRIAVVDGLGKILERRLFSAEDICIKCLEIRAIEMGSKFAKNGERIFSDNYSAIYESDIEAEKILGKYNLADEPSKIWKIEVLRARYKKLGKLSSCDCTSQKPKAEKHTEDSTNSYFDRLRKRKFLFL